MNWEDTEEERREAVELVEEAVAAGALVHKACEEQEPSLCTYQRWIEGGGVKSDGRPDASCPVLPNKLKPEAYKATTVTGIFYCLYLTAGFDL